jgi:WD40 repeat protein
MARPCLLLVLAAGMAWSAGPPVPEPLPAGAKLRLGTARFRHGGLVRSLAFSRDGTSLSSSSDDHTGSVWEVPGGHEKLRFSRPDDELTVIAESAGRFSAVGQADGTVLIYRHGLRTPPEQVRVSKGAVEALAVSPDGKRLAIGADDGVLCVLDPRSTGKALRVSQDGPVHALAWSPDGKWLATNGAKEAIALRDATTGKVERFLGEESIQCLAFAPAGGLLVSREPGGVFRLWDVTRGKEVRIWAGEPEDGGAAATIYQIAFSHDGKTVIGGNLRGGIDLRDVETGRLKGQLRGRHQGRVTAVAVSPRGDLLASGGADHAIHLWRLADNTPLTPPMRPVVAPGLRPTQVAAEPDNPIIAVGAAAGDRTLATSHRDGSLWLRDAAGKKRLQLGSDLGQARPVVAPDGSVVVAVGREARVRLWDARTARESGQLSGHRGGTLAAAFSTDGKRLVTGGRDDRMRLWDVTKRRELLTPVKHSAWVCAVAFGPDGRRVATGTVRGDVRVWSAETGALLAEFTGHRGAVSGLSFSADEKTLVSSSRDTTVLVWDVEKKR